MEKIWKIKIIQLIISILLIGMGLYLSFVLHKLENITIPIGYLLFSIGFLSVWGIILSTILGLNGGCVGISGSGDEY